MGLWTARTSGSLGNWEDSRLPLRHPADPADALRYQLIPVTPILLRYRTWGASLKAWQELLQAGLAAGATPSQLLRMLVRRYGGSLVLDFDEGQITPQTDLWRNTLPAPSDADLWKDSGPRELAVLRRIQRTLIATNPPPGSAQLHVQMRGGSAEQWRELDLMGRCFGAEPSQILRMLIQGYGPHLAADLRQGEVVVAPVHPLR